MVTCNLAWKSKLFFFLVDVNMSHWSYWCLTCSSVHCILFMPAASDLFLLHGFGGLTDSFKLATGQYGSCLPITCVLTWNTNIWHLNNGVKYISYSITWKPHCMELSVQQSHLLGIQIIWPSQDIASLRWCWLCRSQFLFLKEWTIENLFVISHYSGVLITLHFCS